MLILKLSFTSLSVTRSEDEVEALRAKQKGSGTGWNISVPSGFPSNHFDSCLAQSKYLWLLYP